MAEGDVTRGGVNGWSRDRSVRRFAGRLPSSPLLWWECWPVSTVRADGYAVFGDRRMWPELYAHRIVWHVVFGAVPEGLEVDHRCFNRACVNPFHLEAVTLAENRRRRRPVELKSHCPHGHPYSGPNLYVNPTTGRRHCRECMRQANTTQARRERAERLGRSLTEYRKGA